MKKIKFLLVCAVFSICFNSVAQDSSKCFTKHLSFGGDLYQLSAGDTLVTHFLNTGFPRYTGSEWAANSLGISAHANYRMKNLVLGLRLGFINSSELDRTWDEVRTTFYDAKERKIVSHQFRVFLSPTLGYEKKFGWFYAGAHIECPIVISDNLHVTIDSHQEQYANPNMTNMILIMTEKWDNKYKTGLSIFPGVGLSGGLFVSKKMRMTLSVSEYYFLKNVNQKKDESYSFTSQSANVISGGYDSATGTTSVSLTEKSKAKVDSKPSVKISFSYFLSR